MCDPGLIKTAMASSTAPLVPVASSVADPDEQLWSARRGINRRRLLGMSALLGAALTGASVLTPQQAAAAQPLTGRGPVRIADLSHAIHTDFPVYRPFAKEPNIYQSSFSERDGFNALTLDIDEHTGTHMDAPWHFIEDPSAYRTDQIPPSQLVCPLVVVRIADRVDTNLDAEVTIDDLRRWERRYERIPQGALVAMDSGWTQRVLQGQEAFGNWDENEIPHFPGFSHAACEWLLTDRDVTGIAVDSPSLDCGPNSVGNPRAHQLFLGANKYGLEIVAHLDTVPDHGAVAVVGVLKTRGGTGGPVRLLAAY